LKQTTIELVAEAQRNTAIALGQVQLLNQHSFHITAAITSSEHFQFKRLRDLIFSPRAMAPTAPSCKQKSPSP